MLEEGKIDLLSNVRKTPEREEKFAFSKYPLGQSSTILTVRSGNTRYRSGDYANWNGIRIGLLKNSIGITKLDDYAKQKGFKFTPVFYDSISHMLTDLQKGKVIDAVLSNNLRRLHNEWELETLDVAPFYIIVRKDNSTLLSELNAAMEQQETNDPGFRDILWHKYFTGDEDNTVRYTDQERAFIRQVQTSGHQFTAILNPDRYPISYFESNSQQGFIKEISDEIIRRTGLNIVFLPIQTPEEYRQAIKDPKVDIVFDAKSDLRNGEENGLNITRPYISLSAFMLRHRASGNQINKIVLIKGYQIAEKIKPILSPDATIQYCRTTKEAIDLVASGQYDATCLHTTAAEHAVLNDPYDRLEASLLPGLYINLGVGIRDSRNPLFFSILNKAVASLSKDFVLQARQKYEVSRIMKFTFQRLLYNHPILVAGIPILILFLFCGFLWRMLEARKNAYRLGIVFRNLPFRYFFADENGKLLQYSYGNAQETPELRTLDDIPDESVQVPLKKLVANVFATGSQQEDVFIDNGRIRFAVVAPVPKSLFGYPTVIGVSRDITEVQKFRREAWKNEKYFRLTLHSISDAVITTDKNGNITMLNSVAERMTGKSHSEIIGKSHTEICRFINTSDNTVQESPIFQTLQQGRTVELADHTDWVSVDGEHRYHIEATSSPILNERSSIIGTILVIRDVTEKYERRQEVQTELATWEAATKIAQIYHFKFDPKTQKVCGSKNLSNAWPILNGTPIPALEWICPEDLPEWTKRFNEIVDGKEKQTTVEFRSNYDGTPRYFRGFLLGTSQQGGEITGLIQEITPYIEAQQKQTAWKTLWATCLEVMPVTLFIKSAVDEFRYQQCNANFARFIGRSVTDIIGKNDKELFLRPEDAEHCLRHDLEVMAGGKAVELHETVQDVNGILHHYTTVKVPSIDLDGNPVLLGMSLDETEDYNRRQKLDEMLEDWQNVANVAQIASFRLDYNMKVLTATSRINDYWPLDESGLPISEDKYLLPDDVKPYRKMYQDVLAGNKVQASMLCRVPKTNGLRYLLIFIKRNSLQKQIISGLIQDVTVHVLEQKKGEALMAMWKNVVDTIPALFYVKNADDNFRYLQANDKFYNELGMKPEDIIGREEKEFIPNLEEAQRNLKDDKAVMSSGIRCDFISPIHIKNDVLRTYQTVKIPSIDEEGRNILISMSQDVTDEQELSESRKIISSAFETLFSSDNLEADMRVILKNICDFIGFDQAYITCIDEATDSIRMFSTCHPEGARPLFDLKTFKIEHATALPWYQKQLNSAQNNVYHFDFTDEAERARSQYYVPFILDKADEFDVRGVRLNYIMVRDKPWGSVGFVTCGRPIKNLSKNENNLLNLNAHIVELAITRRRTTEQLMKALDNALAADKAKNYFLSSMSHEIRTPLNAVIGFTDLLKDPDLDQETRDDYLNAVSESSHALLALLNDILELSKLTSGTVKYHQVLTNLNDFVAEMKNRFLGMAQEKGLALAFKIEEVPQLYLDQPNLRQILVNLIGNAIKFTKTGGVEVVFAFKSISHERGELTLKVIDTGIGIVPEDQEKMFEPFIQMTQMRGTSSSGTGTGLGLAIVKKSVELEGGTLSLESEFGTGSAFTIRWPNVRLYSEKKTLNHQKDAFDDLADEKTESELQNPIPRVLVVDDAEMVLEIFARMLKWMNVQFAIAHSGKKALNILAHNSFDIVITDLLMPGMSGVELAENIRSDPKYKNIKILAISTENESIMYDKKLFDKVLLKPIVRNTLYEIIFEKPYEKD